MNHALVRSFTSPLHQHNAPRLQSSTSSSSVAQLSTTHDSHASLTSQPSRNSDSTQNTSTSTLFSGTTLTSSSQPGMIAATDNVINRIADKDTSLFQICMTLRARLAGVPGFEEQVIAVEDENESVDSDPVLLLWHVFRKGFPLLLIYNALQPADPLEIDESKYNEAKAQQMAQYKFLQACIKDLGFPTSECYMLSDLKGDEVNMSGFSKVVRQVSAVVDILVQRGLLETFDGEESHTNAVPRGKRTHREHILDELVRTERTYVQHLELLQGFSRHVRQNGVITHDAIHDIFLNLDDLLEFQRRFLVRVEQTNAQHEIDQNWGKLFCVHALAAPNGGKTFGVYEPFIENQRRCEETTMREFEKLRQAGGPPEVRQMVESSTHLTAFLLKPFQRLSKYPLLLRELRDKGGLSEERKVDLTKAIEAVTAVLNRTNASIDKQDRLQAVRDLKAQVEDWKHHRVEAFGDLLLYGTHTVVKGDSSNEKNEREVGTPSHAKRNLPNETDQYRMYLFEKILLCCKEVNMNKAKNRVKSSSSQLDRKGKPRLQLKGRIFMQNVTETAYRVNPGQYTCQIFWRGDDTIEHFIIKFTTEDTMKKWRHLMDQQRRICQEQHRHNHPGADTEFYAMSNQSRENPYAGEDDDATMNSRNGSSTSLRSRSTTGESGPPGRHGKAGMHMSNLPLINTQNANVAMDSPMSPNERMGAGSYFSPGVESPKSSRTSQSSAHFSGMSRQPGYQSGQYNEDHNRYTAPAGSGRTSLARDAQGNPSSSYGPGYALAQSRLRSISNPDVNNHLSSKRAPNANAPPVPSVPHHLTHGSGINRSQTNSPMIGDEYNDGQGLMSPQTGSSGFMDGSPVQLKVKVKVPSEGSSMTLVVPYNISFEQLKARIDAKLQRNTSVSLASGSVKLKYYDEDDLVGMQTDDDVQSAFETFKEQQGRDTVGQLGEVELFCMKSGS